MGSSLNASCRAQLLRYQDMRGAGPECAKCLGFLSQLSLSNVVQAVIQCVVLSQSGAVHTTRFSGDFASGFWSAFKVGKEQRNLALTVWHNALLLYILVSGSDCVWQLPPLLLQKDSSTEGKQSFPQASTYRNEKRQRLPHAQVKTKHLSSGPWGRRTEVSLHIPDSGRHPPGSRSLPVGP